MISKHKIHYKDGTTKTNVRIVEGYRPGPGQAPKQRQIKNLGYLEDYDDPNQFWEMVKEEERIFEESREQITISLDPLKLLKDCKRYSLGHKYLEAIYDYLEIDEFWNSIHTKAEYDIKNIFRYLVTERILNPDSVRAAAQEKDTRYKSESNFQYHQMIRALDLISEHSEELQNYLDQQIKKKIGRKTDYLFYDTTNFYFEKDYATEGALPQAGVSKEHRTEPIVQLGLFMDSNRLPVRMKAFPGNTSDSLTYLPLMKEVKDEQHYKRIISVADKGMNSADNLSYIYFNGDGYVFSQILRGKKGTRYHDKMFDEDSFIWNADRTYKYRLFDEDYEYAKKDANGKIIEKKTAKRKVLIYWKKAIAERERKKREIKLQKAEKFASNNAYGLTHDATQYVTVQHVDSQSGLVADTKIAEVDMAKADEDAKYDGYFCIVTSEMKYDQNKIHEVYGELSYIEESFRICKKDMSIRPVYVWTDEHIVAHLTICFVSLLIIRLLNLKMDEKSISAERMQRALSSFGCEEIAKGVMHLSMNTSKSEYLQKKDEAGNVYYSLQLTGEDETLKDLKEIQTAFGKEFLYANVKQEALAKYLKSIHFAITKS